VALFLAVGAVGGVVLVTPMTGDQDPGQGPVTGQPPTGLRCQHARSADLTPHPHGPGAAKQASKVHGHRELGADPTGLRKPACFQAPAGQLSQSISPALATAAGIRSILRAGQRLQCRQQGLAGFGLQQPVHGHHALPGRGQPQAAPLVTPLAVVVSPLRVGDLLQVAQDPPQSGGSSRPAASNSTGSASRVTCSGRSWVPWARTVAWAAVISPPTRA
jgi:hypothetical protein